MRDVEISIFGCPTATHDGGTSTAFDLSPTGTALFGLLALRAVTRPVRRETLGEHLWPDCPEKRQKARMRTALWRLTQGLPDWARGMVRRSGELIELRLPAGVTLTHDRFDEVVSDLCSAPVSRMTDTDYNRLDRWLRRYCGPLLDGVDADWVRADREKFSDIYCQGLDHQIRYLRENGRDHETIRAGRRLLGVDPYREDVHAAMIGSYARMGRPDDAARQMRTCEALFQRDLGITPATLSPGLAGPHRGFGPLTRNQPPADVLALVTDMQRSLGRLAEQLARVRAALAGASPAGPARDRQPNGPRRAERSRADP